MKTRSHPWIDATLVVRTGALPQINTGIAGREAGVGMVGAGLVRAPVECFVDAVNALAARRRRPDVPFAPIHARSALRSVGGEADR